MPTQLNIIYELQYQANENDLRGIISHKYTRLQLRKSNILMTDGLKIFKVC